MEGDRFLWEFISSDHAMQRIELIHHKRMFWKRRWHFESAWINDSRCERIVSTEMERCDGNIGNFLHQLSSTKQKLGHQNPNPIKEIQVQIQKKKKEMGIRTLSSFIVGPLNIEKKNTIWAFKKDSGEWAESQEELEDEACDFFTKLFSSSRPTLIEHVLTAIHPKVFEDMNIELNADITVEEVRAALFQMHPTKAPSLDGLPALFFQKYWYKMSKFVHRFVVEFLEGSFPFQDINHTLIVLIPKIAQVEQIFQFRPINLCNVLYKITSKVLTNRIKPILNQVIADNQSAFVPGRLILDNIIVAHEIIHHLHNKRQGSMGKFALKLDMSKAYDRVEWVFVQEIMKKMGFNNLFVDKVMNA
ncbi:Uncharacterized protein TCM_004053 [Theobroma cacao]|uniref:Reverse transcriptase domain-containing protein n=1 Tax=Theobroma cacao TaxID=3641 RepID=A0A061DNS1_THECC|nr:Uncharacterized protein TCM_004053 [Theobroma cacao]